MHTEMMSCEALDQRRISLQSTCLIAQCFSELGLEVEPLLKDSGLQLHDLRDPALLISPRQEQRIFANASTLSGSPLIALKLGQRMRISAYGQLGYAMLSSANLGQAIKVMLAHPNILGSYFKLSMQIAPDGQVCLTASDYHHEAALHAFNVELCLSSIKAMLDDVLGQPLRLGRVELSGTIPAHARHYRDFFGDCTVVPAGHDALSFDCGWLDHPLPLADPVTHFEALQQCCSLEARFGRPTSPLLTSMIRRLKRTLAHPPTIEELASEFHCTARTLRRHLQTVGSGYQQLLDELRAAEAKRLLNEPGRPVYLIAEQLGFSETASFRHAFLRWTGMTPRAWRQQSLTRAGSAFA